jgi:hypothetical protein
MALDNDSFAKDVKVLGLLPTSIGADDCFASAAAAAAAPCCASYRRFFCWQIQKITGSLWVTRASGRRLRKLQNW